MLRYYVVQFPKVFALLVQVGCSAFPVYSAFHTSAVVPDCLLSHLAQPSSVVDLMTAVGFFAILSA